MHDFWQCASKVGRLVYHLQTLTLHSNGGLLVRLARCWLINHVGLFDADCEVIAVTGVRYLIYTFLCQQRETRLAPVCTVDLACNLLGLKSFPSKRYLIGIPLSPSWKAAVSMAENTMLNRAGPSTQPCLTPFVTGNGSENSLSFWTRASIPSWNCLTIAINKQCSYKWDGSIRAVSFSSTLFSILFRPVRLKGLWSQDCSTAAKTAGILWSDVCVLIRRRVCVC